MIDQLVRVWRSGRPTRFFVFFRFFLVARCKQPARERRVEGRSDAAQRVVVLKIWSALMWHEAVDLEERQLVAP